MSELVIGPRTQAGKDLLGVDWQTVEHHAEQIRRIENDAREDSAVVKAARTVLATQIYEQPGDPCRGLDVRFVRALRELSEALDGEWGA